MFVMASGLSIEDEIMTILIACDEMAGRVAILGVGLAMGQPLGFISSVVMFFNVEKEGQYHS